MCQERFKRWIIVQTFFEPDFWKSDLKFIIEVKYSRLFVLFVCNCYNGCVALLMKKRKRRLLLVLVRLYASHL